MSQPQTDQRYTKIGTSGEDLALDAGEWVAVRDATTGLIWSRGNIGDKRLEHADAEKACSELELAGAADWRLPSIRELLTLVDYDRYDPAIDIDFFPECRPNWYWTGTPAAPSPGDCAWYVFFSGGGALWYNRDGGGFVRAVRASQ